MEGCPSRKGAECTQAHPRGFTPPSSLTALAQRKTPRGVPSHSIQEVSAFSFIRRSSTSPASKRGWAVGSFEHKQ